MPPADRLAGLRCEHGGVEGGVVDRATGQGYRSAQFVDVEVVVARRRGGQQLLPEPAPRGGVGLREVDHHLKAPDEGMIEVGAEVIYMIRVTNQGSLAGTGIKIVVNLEDSMQYVSASGSTVGTPGANGRTISFAPVASLAPKARAVWRMRVKAVKAGDVRFAVEMNSDQIGRPVHETETTNFYQ